MLDIRHDVSVVLACSSRMWAAPQCITAVHCVPLDLLADDGTLLPKEFEACIFTASFPKGTYSYNRDTDRLRGCLRPTVGFPEIVSVAMLTCAPDTNSGLPRPMYHNRFVPRCVSVRLKWHTSQLKSQ